MTGQVHATPVLSAEWSSELDVAVAPTSSGLQGVAYNYNYGYEGLVVRLDARRTYAHTEGTVCQRHLHVFNCDEYLEPNYVYYDIISFI
jgi:hypothetical protein